VSPKQSQRLLLKRKPRSRIERVFYPTDPAASVPWCRVRMHPGPPCALTHSLDRSPLAGTCPVPPKRDRRGYISWSPDGLSSAPGKLLRFLLILCQI
jgi:hypothetical protein